MAATRSTTCSCVAELSRPSAAHSERSADDVTTSALPSAGSRWCCGSAPSGARPFCALYSAARRFSISCFSDVICTAFTSRFTTGLFWMLRTRLA
jgi:hypothetical protein